jgi:hypothetical protein
LIEELGDTFYNIDEIKLDRSQIGGFIRYLDELIEGGLPIEKELGYQAIKLKLTKRLNEMNLAQIKSLSGHLKR